MWSLIEGFEKKKIPWTTCPNFEKASLSPSDVVRLLSPAKNYFRQNGENNKVSKQNHIAVKYIDDKWPNKRKKKKTHTPIEQADNPHS